MDYKIIGTLFLAVGIIVCILGFFIKFPWSLILIIPGILAIVYGRDMRVGVKGTLTDHLTGRKYREREQNEE